MEFHQLEQFLAIASTGTMRKAAESLYLSQPTLSHNLKKLESELGHQLFDRSHNKMTLTPYGRILQKHTELLIGDWRQLLADLAEEERRQAQTIRVGCYSTVHTFFEMPQLAIAFPALNFEVWVEDISSICTKLQEGAFDLIIVPDCDASSSVDLVPIDDEQAYLSVPVSNDLSKKQTVALDDLRECQLIVPDNLLGLSGWYEEIVRASGADGLLVEYTDREDYLKKLDSTMKCHFSTTLMHRLTSSGSGRMEIPIEGDVTRRTVCYARSAEDKRLDSIAAFLERNGNRVYSGHAFLPYLLSHRNMHNLIVHDESMSRERMLA